MSKEDKQKVLKMSLKVIQSLNAFIFKLLLMKFTKFINIF